MLLDHLEILLSNLAILSFLISNKLIKEKLWKLSCAKHSLIAQHQRRRDLGASELLRMQIEHERAQRPFQPRQRALQINKTRAGDLRGALEVHQAQRFAEVEMLAGGIHRWPRP